MKRSIKKIYPNYIYFPMYLLRLEDGYTIHDSGESLQWNLELNIIRFFKI